MTKSPAVILFDSNGQAMAVEDGVEIPEGTQALLNAGSDGSDAKVILVDEDGRQILVGAGTAGTAEGGVVTVQGVSGGTPIPVAGSFALPSGAATETTLATRLAESTFTGRINTQGQKTMAGSTPVVLASDQSAVPVSGSVSVSNLPATQPVSGSVSVSNFPATQPVSGSVSVSNLPATQAVSASALPLPTGAATETTLAAINTKTPTVGQKTSAASSPVVLASDQASIPVAAVISGTPNVSVSNFPTTQAVSAASLPLPSGAATAANQSAGNASVASIDTKTPALGQAAMAASVPVAIASNQSAVPVSGTVGVSNFPATQPVSASTLPLPTGAAADATLTGGTQKSIVRGGAKGSTVAADVTSTASGANHTALDVVIYDVSGNPITSFGSGSVSVTNFPATQPVSAASLPLPTGAATEATLSALNSKVPAQGQGTKAASLSVTLASDQGALAVSAASLPLPTGAATAAKQPALGTAGTASADVLTVQGIASMTPLRVDGSSTTQPVSGSVSVSNFPATQPVSGSVSVSNFPATQPVSAAALPLPTGAATSAAQTTGNNSLSSIDTKVTGLALDATLTGGTQKAILRAGAKGSTVAADVTSLATGTNHQALAVAIVDGSGTQITSFGSSTVSVSNFPATQAVSASALPLPTGAATSALQSTGNASVGSIDTKTPALVGGRVPVDGSGVTQPVSAASLPLPAGAATAAKQPALGTAGAPSVDVITVQGRASMTPLLVDSSATTQPVSGTVTANIGTSGSLALDATLTGGSLKSVVRGGAKGATTAADVTSIATGANHQALVVAILDALGNQIQSFGPLVSDNSSVNSVTAAATNTGLLAPNTARHGATIYNDSTSILYLKLGTTASTTSFTVKVLANGYYEVPYGYTGRIDGIWAAANGAARITEFS